MSAVRAAAKGRASMSRASRSSWRYVALLTVLALLPVALLAASSIVLASRQVTGEVNRRVQATAAVSSVFVGEQTSALAALVHSYATRPSLAALAQGPRGTAAAAPQLRSLTGAGLGVSGAFVTDLAGTLTNVDPPSPSLLGRNFAFRDWYRGLAASGGPYVSTAYQTALPGIRWWWRSPTTSWDPAVARSAFWRPSTAWMRSRPSPTASPGRRRSR